MHLPGRHILALCDTADHGLESTDPGLAVAVPPGWEVVDQGSGDLGMRLEHIWRTIGQGQAVFFGVDSPDIPPSALQTVWEALEQADAAIGPVGDGGYWCLTAKRYAPPLLTGIDWGTSAVYHQTHDAAREAGLTLRDLPPWHDVDTPDDLLALSERLTQAREPALTQLRSRLDPTVKDLTR